METLEEAAKEFVLSHDFSLLTHPNHLANRCFQLGAKWQESQMYSEEDMIEFVEWIANVKLHGYSKQLYEAMIIHKVKTSKELLLIWKEQFKNND